MCMARVTSSLLCPFHEGGRYAECQAMEAGPPLCRTFAPDAPEAGAFNLKFIESHPAFAAIVVDFMAPDWQREAASGRPQSGYRRSSGRAPETPRSTPRFFVQWRLGRSKDGAEASDTIPQPAVESVLESGDAIAGATVVPPSPPIATPATSLRRPGRVEPVAESRLRRSPDFLGDLRLVERREHLRVEWSSPGSRAQRPPLDLRWHASFDSGTLLLGPQSGRRGCLVYATRMRQTPGERTLSSHEEMVTALSLDEGGGLWRWRNLSLACPAQVVGDLVLLRRNDALWAVETRTGRRRWTCEAGGRHPHQSAIADGKAIFHADHHFRAVDLRSGLATWEVSASRYAPRPVASGDRVVLAGDQELRAVSAADGRDRWRLKCQGPGNRIPATCDERVVFWTWDGFLHAVEAGQGRRLWSRRGRTAWPGDDPLLDAGWVFYRDGDLGDPWLYALDADRGDLHWSVPLEENIAANVCARGPLLYVLNTHQDVVALDRRSGELLWRLSLPVAGMTLVEGALVCWASGVLYCFDVT